MLLIQLTNTRCNYNPLILVFLSLKPLQFFLKGTQLTQLSEEYETCLENIGKTTRTLQLKREELPELEKAFREADARNKEATKARAKQSELASYKRELAWAHVKTKEEVRLNPDGLPSPHRFPRK